MGAASLTSYRQTMTSQSPAQPRLRRPAATLITLATIMVVAGGGTVALATTGFSAIPGVFGGTVVSTVGQVAFERPLAIPPLAESTIDEQGRRVFSLTAQAGSTEFVDDVSTPTAGYNGTHLGPTLVAARGEEVVVDIANELDEPTSVHWHGMKLSADADGGPHGMIEPGNAAAPSWTIDQPAATLWYHPHPHESTERQVAMGLAGLFLLTDDESAGLDVPSEYGVDDIPVIVQDAAFDEAGAVVTGDAFVGSLGDQLLVNGTIGPFFEATTDTVRLRLVNASVARVYDFAFDDAREFALIGTDGGLLTAPLATDHVQLSPGERAEIVIALEPGDSPLLQSRTPELGGIVPFGGPTSARDSFDVLEVRAAASLEQGAALPTRLATIDPLDESTVAAERTLVFDGTSINGQSMELSRIDEVVAQGANEVWTVVNDMARPHSFHIHGVQFQVLSIDGAAPPAELAGWKDTVYLPPNVQFRLIMSFDVNADPTTPYMYHCHLLRHEDQGMMGQFVVVEPGDQAGPVDLTGHSH